MKQSNGLNKTKATHIIYNGSVQQFQPTHQYIYLDDVFNFETCVCLATIKVNSDATCLVSYCERKLSQGICFLQNISTFMEVEIFNSNYHHLSLTSPATSLSLSSSHSLTRTVHAFYFTLHYSGFVSTSRTALFLKCTYSPFPFPVRILASSWSIIAAWIKIKTVKMKFVIHFHLQNGRYYTYTCTLGKWILWIQKINFRITNIRNFLCKH